MNKRFQIFVGALAIAAFAVGIAADGSLSASFTRTHVNADSTLVAIDGSTASTDTNAGLDSDLSPVVLVSRVLRIIKDYYVEDINPFENSEMAHGAVRYMVASLGDPNSRFLSKEQVEVLRDLGQGRLHGLGAVLKIRENKKPDWTDQNLTIVAAAPGSPAEKAGLAPGDIITDINGKWVMSHDPYSEAMVVFKDFASTAAEKESARSRAEDLRKRAITLDEAFDQLSTQQKEPLKLKVRRGTQEMDVAVSTADVSPQVVDSRILEGNVGYVRLFLMTPDSPKAFAAAAKNLADRGAQTLVLDLRNSPGGSVMAAQEIAGILMPDKELAQVIRSRGRKDVIVAKSEISIPRMEIVALVNEGTEGAAEVLAGGIRDSASVRLIGQNTWGNAFERSAYQLEDGAGYTLTTGKFLTPNGTNFNKTGLKPDAVVPMDPTLVGSEQDSQLSRAVLAARRQAA